MRLGTLDDDLNGKIRSAILGVIPDADVSVEGARGHFRIAVTSDVFAGKNAVQRQRLVYGAIKHLMAGDAAPVHAVDSLETHTRS